MAIGKLMTLLLAASAATTASPVAARDETTDNAAAWLDELIANVTAADLPTEKRGFCSQSSNLVVNTGYAKYRGFRDTASGLNLWKGVRYAKGPVGNLRWQAPRAPNLDLLAPVTDANTAGPSCPQHLPQVPGATLIPGDEDCLFLNVAAPPGASGLPVMVWIHGGGYGAGDGSQDMTQLINANGKAFIGVSIQYRLGAFGWLASQEVKNKGVVNAGLLDQAFALAWIKLNICQFGGDPTDITIAGESAGGGSVMYHDTAVGGALGSLLFDKSIAQSPYLPYQPAYNDALPTSRYYAFSAAAGCPSSGSVFSCLVSKDSDTLQAASFAVTKTVPFGYWGFWPVTDNVYITGRPTQMLAAKRVNGKKILVGYNANEGPLFVPPGINTESDLAAWLAQEFPNLSPAQIGTILANNPSSAPTSATAPQFETDGLNTGGYNAMNTGPDANGQKQRANNIYAEATFACPAYWLAEGYSGSSSSRASYLYQYSVPLASHGTDVAAIFGPAGPNLPSDFTTAIRKAWGNFVLTGDPSITNALANGAGSANPNAPNPASDWPEWTVSAPKFLNWNTTGGTPYAFTTQWGTSAIQYTGGLNAISVQNSNTWEAGRGARCNFYRSLGPFIPA